MAVMVVLMDVVVKRKGQQDYDLIFDFIYLQAVASGARKRGARIMQQAEVH